ncbi:MAG: hypothetical protein ABIL09_23225 [Gemmatimonadota bacterium]
MYLTADQLVAHEPKTGGTWLSQLLGNLQLGKQIRGQHDPLWSVNQPELFEGRQVVGTIRNPWTWYCSLYVHAVNGSFNHRFLLKVYGRGSLRFKDVLFGMTHPWELPFVPDHQPGVIWPLLDDTLMDFHRGEVGLAAWCARYSYGTNVIEVADSEWLADTFLATDRLNEAVALLLEMPFEVIDASPPHNVRGSARGFFRGAPDYADWYDSESVRWVQESDRLLIDQFGFEPFRPSPQALYQQERQRHDRHHREAGSPQAGADGAVQPDPGAPEGHRAAEAARRERPAAAHRSPSGDRGHAAGAQPGRRG